MNLGRSGVFCFEAAAFEFSRFDSESVLGCGDADRIDQRLMYSCYPLKLSNVDCHLWGSSIYLSTRTINFTFSYCVFSFRSVVYFTSAPKNQKMKQPLKQPTDPYLAKQTNQPTNEERVFVD